MSELYLSQGKFDRAITELEQAVKRNDRAVNFFVTLEQLYIQQKRFAPAVALAEARLTANPKDEVALTMLGQVQAAQGDTVKAMDSFKKALAAKPDQWLAANNLAYLISDKAVSAKELDEALAYASTAQKVQPENPTVLDTLGWINYRKGAYPQAAELLIKAQAKAAGSAVINYHLGMALYKSGKKSEAKTSLQKALTASKSFPGRDEAEKTLKSI
jgi:tetratricopeptide (TPR) repeat protein